MRNHFKNNQLKTFLATTANVCRKIYFFISKHQSPFSQQYEMPPEAMILWAKKMITASGNENGEKSKGQDGNGSDEGEHTRFI